MLVDSAQVNLPAAVGSQVNVFLGRPIEFIGAPSVARLLLTADAPSVTCSWTINVAGIQHVPIATGTTVNQASAAGHGPKDDEDELITNVPMPAGSRNSLTVTNNSGVATAIRYRATILP
jgi:hypothetical protein